MCIKEHTKYLLKMLDLESLLVGSKDFWGDLCPEVVQRSLIKNIKETIAHAINYKYLFIIIGHNLKLPIQTIFSHPHFLTNIMYFTQYLPTKIT